jgi:hypothetical protein
MLKTLPLDTARLSFIAIDMEPVPDYDAAGNRNGGQRTDSDGRLLFRVNTLCLVEGESGGETIQVRIAVDNDPPTINPLSPVKFQGLVARPWQQDGRSGIALIADGVEVEGGTTNGRKKDPFTPAQEVAA